MFKIAWIISVLMDCHQRKVEEPTRDSWWFSDTAIFFVPPFPISCILFDSFFVAGIFFNPIFLPLKLRVWIAASVGLQYIVVLLMMLLFWISLLLWLSKILSIYPKTIENSCNEWWFVQGRLRLKHTTCLTIFHHWFIHRAERKVIEAISFYFYY